MKKLSISITTFNEEKVIERLLKNICSFADEIIIIDGQSEDNTVKIVKKYTNDPIILTLHELHNIARVVMISLIS